MFELDKEKRERGTSKRWGTEGGGEKRKKRTSEVWHRRLEEIRNN